MLISSIPFQQNTLINDTNSQKCIKTYYSNNQILINSAKLSLSRGLTSTFLINEVNNKGISFINLLNKSRIQSHATPQINEQITTQEPVDNKSFCKKVFRECLTEVLQFQDFYTSLKFYKQYYEMSREIDLKGSKNVLKKITEHQQQEASKPLIQLNTTRHFQSYNQQVHKLARYYYQGISDGVYKYTKEGDKFRHDQEFKTLENHFTDHSKLKELVEHPTNALANRFLIAAHAEMRNKEFGNFDHLLTLYGLITHSDINTPYLPQKKTVTQLNSDLQQYRQPSNSSAIYLQFLFSNDTLAASIQPNSSGSGMSYKIFDTHKELQQFDDFDGFMQSLETKIAQYNHKNNLPSSLVYVKAFHPQVNEDTLVGSYLTL
ncbi:MULTISPECIES: hypothetical protein [Providencia]|uniref:Uncharacterized protein n=4 Tax=Providencia rustigianii TaxID=158850 RepID=D1P0W2_9GAMM|nr:MULTISPECIES: hypothetical protein [Providencia]EFB72981.1 hypothetical protein PROVRUST_05780 [Providencia rustigianii DSM 4541]MTC56426.1 hypothetical protein [Providencia rustigianii]SPY76140.1 Uncharacterised protein [Providencia rustigianii]SUC25302.1 Uncharacterised protein [Providencia rustigianii]SUC34108.1 Uncharacterised protein [Providencia rustigianii]